MAKQVKKSNERKVGNARDAKAKKSAASKIDLKNANKTDEVNEFMQKLEHPLKAEIEVVRAIIKNANNKIAERIKWNAPSFYYIEDMMTIHVHEQKFVHLIFHNAAIAKIKSALLQGDYKDRRMVYLNSMSEVKAAKKELENIMNELIKLIEK